MKKKNGRCLKIMKKFHHLLRRSCGKKQIKNYGERSKQAKMYQKHQTKYPLSGKLYCEKHKCYYVRKIRHYKNKEDVIFWYCSSFHKAGKKDCPFACFKEDDLYNILLSIFKNYEAYKEEICEELISFYKKLSKEEENIDVESELQKELNSLKIKKEKLVDLALDGFLSKEDLKCKELSLEEQINGIRSKLKELENNKNIVETQEKEYKILRESIIKHLTITRDNLENYIEELVDKIIVSENKEDIRLQIAFVGKDVVDFYVKL